MKTFTPDHPLIERMRSEFLDMPGLCLTIPQASRLWNLDPQTSRIALQMLVDTGFLMCRDDGRFTAAHLHAHAPAERHAGHSHR